jgi:hypothetical protein
MYRLLDKFLLHRKNLSSKFLKVNKVNADLHGYNFWKSIDLNFIWEHRKTNGNKYLKK